MEWEVPMPTSLPLMRKTFIEALATDADVAQAKRSLPLMRKTFIEAKAHLCSADGAWRSLPLMRKTFIEAASCSAQTSATSDKVSSAYAEDFH